MGSHAKFNVKSSIDTVKKWRIYSVSEADEYYDMRAYDCIDYEVQYEGKTFILHSGVWRSINSDFKSQIEDYIKFKVKDNQGDYLPNDVSIRCIENKKVKYKEEIYNSYTAKMSPDMYLFDKSKIKIANEKRYEICDLFHAKKEFIHVKVFKSGTNSLSHLFCRLDFI